MFWYSNQNLCIKWGTQKSSFFTISNGVRQGRILSPVLFSIYMDDLSVLLSQSRIGCHIEGLCIKHVFYADDLCLMAPCAIALQELINMCFKYSIEIDLNRLVSVAKLSLLSYVEVFTQRFIVHIFGHNIKKLHSRSFVLHITTYIVKY